MYVRTDLGSYCEGFNDCGVILILYAMKSGIQGYQHPNPGADYVGGTSRAYLPDNKEGRLVLQLLKKAWQMKMTHRVSEWTTVEWTWLSPTVFILKVPSTT